MSVPCEACEKEASNVLNLNGATEVKRVRRTIDGLVSDFKLKHGNRFRYHDLYDTYSTMKHKVWIKCVKHNHFFRQTPINHLNTEICCPKCIEEIYKFPKSNDT